MKVFLSWSGQYAKDVSTLFADWIPCVLQQVDIFMSTNAIDAGDRWNDVISAALDDIDFGILFVTKENKDKPWLLFEAGALAKNVSRSKVIPILIDTKEIDLSKSPLFGFQNCELSKDGVFNVMRSIYNSLPTPIIDRDTLTRCLEKWWPDLKAKYKKIRKPAYDGRSKKSLSDGDRIERIEDTMSDMLSMLSRMNRNVDSRHSHNHSNFHKNSSFNPESDDIGRYTYSEILDLIKSSYSLEILTDIKNALLALKNIPEPLMKDLLQTIKFEKNKFSVS